jgi:hypothetical protein
MAVKLPPVVKWREYRSIGVGVYARRLEINGEVVIDADGIEEVRRMHETMESLHDLGAIHYEGI